MIFDETKPKEVLERLRREASGRSKPSLVGSLIDDAAELIEDLLEIIEDQDNTIAHMGHITKDMETRLNSSGVIRAMAEARLKRLHAVVKDARDFIVNDSLYFEPPINLVPRMESALGEDASSELSSQQGNCK